MHKGVRLALRVTLLLLTLLEAVSMGGAGIGKFVGGVWITVFALWGYATWFRYLIGAAELGGGVALFVPRLASWAGMGLMGIMFGAVITTVRHPVPQHGFTWVSPAVHLCLLSVILAMRWRERWRPGAARGHARAVPG